MPSPSDADPGMRVVFQGRRIALALQSVTLSDGRPAEREVVLHRGSVALLPIVDPEHVALIRNRRPSVGKELIEIPAGTLEPGEDPALCAARELKEETGYTAERIRHLVTWYVSPGVITERMHLYLCEDLTPGDTELELDEAIVPMVVPIDQALDWIDNGTIDDAKTMLALLLYDRMRNPERGWD